MKPPAVPEADFAVHASVYGKLLIRLAPRHVTTLHCMPPPRPRRPSLRIHALAGGEAILRCPAGLPPMLPLCTPSLGLFGPACRPSFLPLLQLVCLVA